jgi:gamma-glutamylcyclotransferase (GGCT)/AIG2-like uncharacterized protein YtfP
LKPPANPTGGHAHARRLFVYGTLRKGGSNDIARLVPDAAWVAEGRMRGVLFDLGDYPTLLADTAADWVRGEIYDIPEPGWAVLDALEDVVTPEHANGEYFRVSMTVHLCGSGEKACEVYVANPAAVRLDRPIDGGDWLAHLSKRR